MTTPVPVIFIHGLWLHATSWNPWVELFRRGRLRRRSAPGWPGDPDTVEEARANPESIADHGIDDVVEHYAKIIDGLAVKPILIGHSFGGMIAQKLLGQDLAAAAVAIDAAQIKGVLPLPLSALRATLPVFKNPANKHRAVSLTAEQFRYAFGNAISEEESDELLRALGDPGAGQAAVRGRRRQLRPALAGQGRHRQRDARPAAADHGRQGPHRARGRHQGHPQAVPPLRRGHRHHGLPRPGALPDHRPRLAEVADTPCPG